MGKVNYLEWWNIADLRPDLMRQCEDVTKLICGASDLKSDDPRLKSARPTEKMCVLCDGFETENVRHLILHCPHLNDLRDEMLLSIRNMPNGKGNEILIKSDNLLYTLVGKRSVDFDEQININFNTITVVYISRMYRIMIRERQGIG